jgi:homoserine O-acetyltransferase/O-succinyltransferase
MLNRTAQTVTFNGRTLPLEGGGKLTDVTVAYETYGTLSPAKDNAVLVCHALSGDAHAAGYHGETGNKPGWWDGLIGPGKAIDTDRYFVICSNFLGSCYGTTGPTSIDPATGEPYRVDFPFVTVRDMVELQAWLLDHLGIPRLLAVTGGSLGGMQALEWAIRHPGRVVGAIPIATTARMSAQGIALNEVARQAIIGDPEWQGGAYPLERQPENGLSLARMIGHITYLSEEAMHRKFGRHTISGKPKAYTFSQDFQVEGYLRHQGRKFVERFDANTYLYITRTMDYFDLEGEFGSLTAAFSGCSSDFLVVSFTSDWLFPPEQSLAMVRAMKRAGLDVSYVNLESDQGHDAFLLPGNGLGELVAGFLARLARKDKG